VAVRMGGFGKPQLPQRAVMITTFSGATNQSLTAVEPKNLARSYALTRAFSEELCETLQAEDCVVQTMPEVSPTKWHLAHTSWFFETFVLKTALRNYRSPHPEYAFLFNSYYNAAGKMHCRPKRGLISRPTLEQTRHYRRCIDEAMASLFERTDWTDKFGKVVELGINHEQQHQELMITDIKNVFSENPLRPVFRESLKSSAAKSHPSAWIAFPSGVYQVGFERNDFHFDNEEPLHRVFCEAFELSSRLVTNADYQAFIDDGGYRRPEFWLSLGWATVQEHGWRAPLYWESSEVAPDSLFSLSGTRRIEDDEPVAHLSYFEADAFARWAGARLPTEFEWEVAAHDLPVEGNFVDTRSFHPLPLQSEASSTKLNQMYGDLWEWTSSSYAPYPGYKPAPGALGEYNGKFMCNQYVLRGGSCATSQSHIRKTYRNFFPPSARWQFTGLRLARSAEPSGR
jgi:ergothioneine biosynthesis protein EgtB